MAIKAELNYVACEACKSCYDFVEQTVVNIRARQYRPGEKKLREHTRDRLVCVQCGAVQSED